VFSSGSNHRYLSIQNSTFRHLIIQATSFFSLSGVSTIGDKLGENYFKNCTFENISAYHSVMLVQNNGISIILDSVSMNNLRKLESTSADDLQLEAQWPGGLCALTNNDASITIKNSNFTNIYGHCFGTRQTAITVEDSIFDNTNLEETPISLESKTAETIVNSLTINSGTSWVNVEDLSRVNNTWGYQAIFKRNIFKTNKAMSLYGGVIIHDYLIVNQIIRQLDMKELI